MHELSIALALIDAASEVAAQTERARISQLFLRLGARSCVVPEALEFSFKVAAEGTLCDGAILVIERVPLRVLCAACHQETVLEAGEDWLCGGCEANTVRPVAGQELELLSVEVVDDAPAHC